MPREPRACLSRSPPDADTARPYCRSARNGKGKAKAPARCTNGASSSASTQPPPARDKDLGADRWPLEYFPPPPADGHWLPKNSARIVNRIPPKPAGLPPPPPATLDPPVMPLSYPPLPPLSEDDPTWLPQMVADVQRQRSHVEAQLVLAHAEATSALAEAALAQSELEEQIGLMQTFSDHVARIAGNGFLRRMLRDVDDMIARRTHPDDESSDESEDELEREEVEDAVTDESSDDEGKFGQTEQDEQEEGLGKVVEEENGEESEEAEQQGDEEIGEAREEETEKERQDQLVLRVTNGIPATNRGSPQVQTNPAAVGRRRCRPLRRDPYRLGENAFGDPILYEVID